MSTLIPTRAIAAGGRDAARRLYMEARNFLAVRFPQSGADEVIAYRLLALDVGEPMARRLLADPRYHLGSR